MSGQLHAPPALPPGERFWYPLDKGLGGPQSRSGQIGEEKRLTPGGNRTSAVQPVIIILVAPAISRSRDGSVGMVTGYRLDH
jgi:hypothetical protein